MAELASTQLTMADWLKRLDPDGSVAAVVELLTEMNEILEDMVWVEANDKTSHTTTVRTGLPAVVWRLLNYGITKSKSRTAQVTDAIGMLEAEGQVDKDLAELNGLKASFMASENKAFIEAMMQEMAETIIYGNSGTAPAEFTGLAPRFNALSGSESADQILNAAGDSDRTSVWLIGWDDSTIHGIFPKGSPTGLQVDDHGLQIVQDADGNDYRAYINWYQWKAGLTVRDYRYVVRIANIDSAALTKDATSGSADLVDLMIEATERMQSLSGVRPAFYCNRVVRSFLRRQIKNDNNVRLTQDQVAGKRVMAFDDIPVRRLDAITNAETAVS